MINNPIRNWLSLRVRILCVLVFLVGGLLPPYVPKDALAAAEEDIDVETPQFLLVEDGFLMKSSSLTEQGARRAYAEGIIHKVREGETLRKLADKYKITPETIIWANKIPANTSIQPGQDLIILPVDGVIHTVARGQTLQQISELYSIPALAISTQNKIQNSFILAGEELIIPGGKPIIASIASNNGLSFNPNVQGGYTGRQPNTAPPPPRQGSGGEPRPTGDAAQESYGVLGMPCNNCYYTQYYRTGHYAVDIQTKGGGPIFASEDGVVIRADTGWNGGYGNVIEIDHGNGLVTLYAHNKEFYIKKGEKVTRGQEIAFMGNTGNVHGVTGIHIHFEVRVNGVKKNPLLYLK